MLTSSTLADQRWRSAGAQALSPAAPPPDPTVEPAGVRAAAGGARAAAEAGKAFLARLQEHANRDKEISVSAFLAQLEPLRAWGQKAPADLSVKKQPVLVVKGDDDRMVPTVNTHDLARRLPNSLLIIYPDAGHGRAFQFHADFVRSTLGFLGP